MVDDGYYSGAYVMARYVDVVDDGLTQHTFSGVVISGDVLMMGTFGPGSFVTYSGDVVISGDPATWRCPYCGATLRDREVVNGKCPNCGGVAEVRDVT
jgi:Zn finger protein HypA/HybF involved in hydrogenase expression